MSQSSCNTKTINVLPDVLAYRQGDLSAADRLSASLYDLVDINVGRMLGNNSPDHEDTIQESIMAALTYLDRDTAFQGDFVKLTVTIARNRCRDIIRKKTAHPEVDIEPMIDWLADTGQSPLDHLQEEEQLRLLQQALRALQPDCSSLLRALYIEEQSTESIRERLGLTAVQSVYYRREICLQKIKKFLQTRMTPRSGSSRVSYSPGKNRPGETL